MEKKKRKPRKNVNKTEASKKIVEDVAEGLTLVEACKKHDLNVRFFYEEIDNDESLGKAYTRARECRAERLEADMFKTMNELKTGVIDAQTARVLLDQYKWFACKFFPRMYGDKQTLEHTGEGFKIEVVNFADNPNSK